MCFCVVSFCLYSASFAALWNATPRIFPTCLRSQFSGFCLCFFHAGAVAACLVLLFTNKRVVACVVLLFLPLTALCCFFFVYNVHKRELPDVLFDAVNFKR